MASKSFISARIPDDLQEKLESYSQATGESKSRILIDALSKYLNADSSTTDKDLNLYDRILYFERWVSNRLNNVEDRIMALENSKAASPQEHQPIYLKNQSDLLLPPGKTSQV
jgi:metal-responsive CopG/Arc/MetJ family transcriptional regulator